MKTVKEVSKLTGVSVRTLQYYDNIGLLKPMAYSEAGYRLYDEECLETLQQILLYRELEFSLEDIKEMLYSPGYNKDQALQQQIELLKLKVEHMENLLSFAEGIQKLGGTQMNFSVFRKDKLADYAARAKEQWGSTEAYKEYEERSKDQSAIEAQAMSVDFMQIFVEFGTLKEGAPDSAEAQNQVEKLQQYITDHYYTCTDQILKGLGQMYVADPEFKKNIDAAGGEGTAEFVSKAISLK